MNKKSTDEAPVALWQLHALETAIGDASPEELPELHPTLLALSADLTQALKTFVERYGIQKRIEENEMYAAEKTRHYYPAGPDDPYIPLVQFDARITNLKDQL